MEKFWMVLGRGEPVVRHNTYGAAFAEAERLAKLHVHEGPFVVLEAKCAIAPIPIEVAKGDHIPVYYR